LLRNLGSCQFRYDRAHRLEENLGAVAVDLTAKELQEIDSAASAIEISGERYSEAAQKTINR
jgi:hypothetical protein